MSPRLTVLIVAGFLSLMLLLAALTSRSRHSRGFFVSIPQYAGPSANCGDRVLFVVEVRKDNSIMLNSEPIPEGELGARLKEVYSRRLERVLFVSADPEVSFQRVAEVLDIAQGSVRNLEVGLLTPAMDLQKCWFIAPPPSSRAWPLPGLHVPKP